LSGRYVSTFIGSSSGPLRNRSKSYLYFSALWYPKLLQIILQECKIYELLYIFFNYFIYSMLHEFVYIMIYVTDLALIS